jgi:catalase
LQDFYLIEQMANFNRERIPERQPHAKGGGAFGTFVVSPTTSALHQGRRLPARHQTEVVIRFSTVAGERGSPDTWRDPRGFAVKFYTSEGNLDIVGEQHAGLLHPRPDQVPELHPFAEAAGRQQPARPRHAVGLLDALARVGPSGDLAHGRPWHPALVASHERLLVAHLHVGQRRGERFWVKYHFKTDQGVEFLTQADADRIAGEDADYHQRDLYEAIERGEFPSWSLKMQIMPFDEAKTYRFNPFDLTKVWPHGDYPLIDVGTLTLNRNVTDYHTEMEQAAFQPNNTVPGTGLSPTRCCSPAASPTPTPTGPGSASTTSRSR